MPVERRSIAEKSSMIVARMAYPLSVAATLAFLVSHSRFLEFLAFGDVVRTALLFFEIAIIILGISLAIFSGRIVIASASIITFAAVPFYAYIFGVASGEDPVLSSGGDYFFISIAALFFLVLNGGMGERFLKTLYRMSVVYAVLYILVVIAISANILSVGAESHIVLDSGGGVDRGLRVTLINSFVIFGTCVATISTFREFRIKQLACLFIFCLCLFLSGSRYVSALMCAAIVMFLIFQNSKLTRNLFFLIFFVGLLFVGYVISAHNFNPFNGFVNEASSHGDVSAWARWKDVDIANKLIPDHWLFGVGISNGIDAYRPVSGVPYFYPQDIGLLGVFIMFGIFGFSYYVFICFCACFSYQKLQVQDFSIKAGLGLAGAVMTVFSHLAPVFTANAMPFAAMYLALFAWRPRRLGNFRRSDEVSRLGTDESVPVVNR